MKNPAFANFSPSSYEVSNQQVTPEEFSTQSTSNSTSQQNEDSASVILSQLDDVVRKIIPELSDEKVKQHSQYFINYLYQQKEKIDQTLEELKFLTGNSPALQRPVMLHQQCLIKIVFLAKPKPIIKFLETNSKMTM